MTRSFVLAVALFGVWLLWSGHTEGLILGFGAGSCIFVVLLCRRMGIVDKEGQPFHLTLRLLLYFPWLVKEIVVANIQVAGKILHPKMPIDPAVVVFKPTQKTDLGRVILANSITLTPGTISITAEGGKITVHAVDRKMMDVEENEMDRRVTIVEGKS